MRAPYTTHTRVHDQPNQIPYTQAPFIQPTLVLPSVDSRHLSPHRLLARDADFSSRHPLPFPPSSWGLFNNIFVILRWNYSAVLCAKNSTLWAPNRLSGVVFWAHCSVVGEHSFAIWCRKRLHWTSRNPNTCIGIHCDPKYEHRTQLGFASGTFINPLTTKKWVGNITRFRVDLEGKVRFIEVVFCVFVTALLQRTCVKSKKLS